MLKNKKSWIIISLCLLLLCGCVSVEQGSNNDLAAVKDIAAVMAGINSSMDRFLTDNHDDYAAYLEYKELIKMIEDYEGEFGGIGVYISLSLDNNYAKILEVMKGQPAEAAGVRAGDIILKVNDQDVAGLDSSSVSDLVRGPLGTTVKLLLEGEDKVKREVSVVRQRIKSVTVEGIELKDHSEIAYIVVYSFSENTPSEFATVFNELNAVHKRTGIIIDLRGNGGGSFPAALKLGSLFVAKRSPLVWVKTSDGLEAELSTGKQLDLPVVCLQNGGSASASEVLIGSLVDNGCAVSVGTQSYGKGITQNIYSLRSGAGLRFTNGKYFTPNMTDLHKIGLAPTYEVELAKGTVSADLGDPDKDSQLAYAIQLLSKD